MSVRTELSDTPIRVYRLDDVDMDPDEPSFLGACDDVSLTDLLRSLRRKGRIDDRTRVGILFRPIDGQPGEWLVRPWA
jgi:hypothetical protein